MTLVMAAWRARLSRRRKFLVGVGAFVLCAAAIGTAWLAGAVGQTPLGSDPIYERIRASGVLHICLDASFPPFEFVGDDQAIAGFDADLAREVGRRLALSVQFVNVGFDTLYSELAAQHCDAIVSALPFDRMRTQDVAYSDIYFRDGEVLVYRASDPRIERLSDTAGQVIAVELGTSAEALAQQLQRRNGYRVQSFSTLDDAEHALEAGQVRAVLAEAVSARLLVRAHAGLAIASEPVGEEPNYVIAAPIDAPALLAAINTQLRAMVKDGNLERLVDKWF